MKAVNSAALRRLIVVMSVLTGCQGGGGSVEPGITLSIVAQLTPTADATGALQPQGTGSKVFQNSDGVTVRIDTGYLVLWSVSLESRCDEADFVAAAPWWSWFIASAHAHSASTPLQWGSPTVIDLTANDMLDIELGTLTPPPGDYCGAETQLLGADADANGLPASPDMIGRSLYLDGEYSTDGGQSWTPFSVDTSVSLLPAKRIFPSLLSLSGEQREAELHITVAYQDWFNGVDMAHAGDSNQLLFNVTASIRAAAQPS